MNKDAALVAIDRDNWIGKMRWALGLQDWTVTITWGQIGEGRYDAGSTVLGRCEPHTDYRKAHISLNHEAHADESELKDTLRHELIHVMLAELELFKHQSYVSFNDAQREALDVTWYFALERIVGNIERMLDCQLGLTGDKLIKLAVKHEASK